MIDLEAPIIPWQGLGGISLYSHLRDIKGLIENEKAEYFLYDKFLVRYEIKGKLYLFFNLINGKLFKVTALRDYKGLLFNKIHIGQNMEEILNLEDSFEYDDFEEVYTSKKGVFIETDPILETAEWISVFIRELETDEFDKALW